MNDWELIQKYCNGSESAFEALVKRYVDYVYCAALRQVRDPALAEDVSQAVFLLLSQKVKTFRADTILISWLFRTTQNIAARAVRSELRRQRRESEAAIMNPTTTTPESDLQWERVSPVLDQALAALPNKDRDAVLLRFIGRKPFSEVGAEIGASEDAAKKRVSRALGRLREFFLRRGTTLSVAAIGVLLGEHVVHAAPVALSTKISTGVLTANAASNSAAALLQATLRDLFWHKVKWGAALGAGVVAVLSLGTAAMRQASHRELGIATPPAGIQNRAVDDSKTINAATLLAAEPTTTNHALTLTVVRLEDHQPIPKARVLVDTWTLNHRNQMLDSTTDNGGVLKIPVPTNTFGLLEVWVSAEDRVPMVTKWEPHEFNEPVISYTLPLEHGQTASGTVVDEFGEPIPGATVYFQTWESGGLQTRRAHRVFNWELSKLYTDVNGHWTTTQFPPPAPAMGEFVRVTSPAYVPVSIKSTDLKGLLTNAVIVLSNGVALAGRVTTINGKPIPNATVAKETGVYINTRTDSDGRFSWPHIEPGQTFLHVEAEGFETNNEITWATNSANECAFAMKPTTNTSPQIDVATLPQVTLKGTVVDADTGKLIPFFRVMIGIGSTSPRDAALSYGRFLGEGHDGQFAWQIARGGGFQLQVEAEGYMAAVSDSRDYDNAGAEFTFKLHRATALVGRVLTPDGLPAKTAQVTLVGYNTSGMMSSPGQLIEPNAGTEDSRTDTDTEGNFKLLTKTGARGIAFVHESGTALLTFAEATNAPVILHPWAIVEGTLYLNGHPAPDQNIDIDGTQFADADSRITFFFTYRTKTDASGHFRFDKALPGTNSIYRWVGGSSDLSTNVQARYGTVTTVDLRRDGRPVIGRIVFSGSANDIDWDRSEGSLVGKNRFPMNLSKDGSMHVDDVPPGTYTLSIELKFASAAPTMYSKTFGSLEKQVIIPLSENESKPLDLGSLVITQTK